MLEHMFLGSTFVPRWNSVFWFDVGIQSIAATPTGNILVVGTSSDKMFLAKLTLEGAIEWQRTLDTASASVNDIGYGVTSDAGGNVYVTGQANVTGTASYIAIAKYNGSGTLQWQRSLKGTNNESGNKIAADSSGNVYSLGMTISQGAGNADAYLFKYDSAGALQWQRSLGDASGNFGLGLALDSSANIYVAGYTATTPSTAFVAKYDASGAMQWQRKLSSGSSTSGYGIASDASGNSYVITVAGTAYVIAKYDASGAIQWQRLLSVSSSGGTPSICLSNSGDVFIAATAGGANLEAVVAKYDASGAIQWQRKLGTNVIGGFNGIADCGDGTIAVASPTTGNFVVRLPQDGSGLGTIGSYTYAASTFSESAGTLTDAASTLTDAARTLTDAVGALKDAAGTSTTTVTQL